MDGAIDESSWEICGGCGGWENEDLRGQAEAMTEEIQSQSEMPTDIGQMLASLRNVVSVQWNSDAPAIFDEFIREHEWDLALHVVCDCLLEQTTPPEPAVVEQIQALHDIMKIGDSCVMKLRRKAG